MAKDWYCTLKCNSASECTRRLNGKCSYEYDAKYYPDLYRWSGDGDPPPRWTAMDGTIVYRTFSDFCD